MKTLTSYEQVKTLCKDFYDFDIDEYTDEELEQISRWLVQAKQEALPDKLENLTNEEISWYNFDNENFLCKVINEEGETFLIDNKKIIGLCIIDYPEFKIIKEKDKNNFYRIMKK